MRFHVVTVAVDGAAVEFKVQVPDGGTESLLNTLAIFFAGQFGINAEDFLKALKGNADVQLRRLTEGQELRRQEAQEQGAVVSGEEGRDTPTDIPD